MSPDKDRPSNGLQSVDIVCLGEALIDFKGVAPLAFRGFVGGSPLNVAVAAARLGARSALATQLSTDMFGASIREHLGRNRVNTSWLSESDAPTTLAFVSERDGEAEFSFVSNGAADSLYDPRPRPAFTPGVRFVQFGSISLLREPAATAIAEIVAAHRRRCTVVFDPNVRPDLIPDRASYLTELEGWLALTHIVKVSRQDVEWLHPGLPVAEVAAAWLARGVQVVMVTRGSSGVSLYRRSDPELRIDVPRVPVADTVGAGDTFTGALMAALLELPAVPLDSLPDSDWRELLSFAAAAAAINCSREGADPPQRQELEEFLGKHSPDQQPEGDQLTGDVEK